MKNGGCPHGVERLCSRQDQGGAAVASGDPAPESHKRGDVSARIHGGISTSVGRGAVMAHEERITNTGQGKI